MSDDGKALQWALEKHFAAPVKITSRTPVSGGCINQAWKLELSNGESVFMKQNSARLVNMFHAEAAGLKALSVPGGPRVPRSIAVYADKHSQFILMGYISSGARSKHTYEAFGRALATLHGHSGDGFGFHHNNYIGSTAQINTPTAGWPEFFGTHRLGFQMELAGRQGLAGASLVRKIEKIIALLDRFLPSDAKPSILHGDLWGGNVMTDENGDAVIIDPAAYYGHFEADLAMTELFGSLPAAFYAAYNEVQSISPEYHDRKEIYNLYHVLNHLNMFGGSYAAQANAILNRFV